MNWNFQEILTKDPSSAWGCDTSGNIPPCGVALRRTCRCTELPCTVLKTQICVTLPQCFTCLHRFIHHTYLASWVVLWNRGNLSLKFQNSCCESQDIWRTVFWRYPLLIISWTPIITLCIDKVQIQNFTLVYINWTMYVHVATKPSCHQLLEKWLTEIPILPVFYYVTLIQSDASYKLV